MEENNQNINQSNPNSTLPVQTPPTAQTPPVSNPTPLVAKTKLKLPFLIAGIVLFLVLIGTTSTTFLFVVKSKTQVSAPKNSSLNLSELNGFPIYPNAVFVKKEKTNITCGISAQGTCYVKGVAYSWSTKDDFIKVSDWYKQNKSNSEWKIETGKGTYSTGFMAGPGSGGSIVTMSNGTTYYYLTIGSHHSTPTTITLQIPDTPIGPSQNQDSTANWKTYSGNGFSFRYPSTYKLVSSDGNKITFDGTFEPGHQNISGELLVNLNQTIDFVKSYSCGDNTPGACYMSNGTKEYNGIKFRVFEYFKPNPINPQGQGSSYYIAQTLENPKIEFLHGVIGGGVPNSMSQILSTFKFTDQNSTSACIPQPSICKNPLVGAYPKECDEPANGWCPEYN